MKEHLLDNLRVQKVYEIGKNHPSDFMREYCDVQHMTKGVIKYSPTVVQQKVLRAYHNGHTIVSGPRDCGITITTAMYMLWYAMFNSNKTMGILANKLDMSIYNLDLIRRTYYNFPDWLQEINPLIQNNKRAMEFSNGSMIHAFSTSPDHFRGKSYDLFHLDNFDCLRDQKQDEILSVLLPSMIAAEDSKVLITSTGVRQHNSAFDRIFYLATQGLSDFTAIEIVPDI